MFKQLSDFKLKVNDSIDYKEKIISEYRNFLPSKSDEDEKKILWFINDFNYWDLSDEELFKSIEETFPDFTKKEHELLLEAYKVFDKKSPIEAVFKVWKFVSEVIGLKTLRELNNYYLLENRTKYEMLLNSKNVETRKKIENFIFDKDNFKSDSEGIIFTLKNYFPELTPHEIDILLEKCLSEKDKNLTNKVWKFVSKIKYRVWKCLENVFLPYLNNDKKD